MEELEKLQSKIAEMYEEKNYHASPQTLLLGAMEELGEFANSPIGKICMWIITIVVSFFTLGAGTAFMIALQVAIALISLICRIVRENV